ncbi:Sir2 family NAD-dependent protein deacetylase [Chloroflexota bacterium]
MASDINQRIGDLTNWISESKYLVVFTGAGISTEAGLPDYRGPDGVWTRQEKGLPAPKFNWSSARPSKSHMAIADLQSIGKLTFLITQNIDNLHSASGIRDELLAELHGNRTKLRCDSCGFKCDSFPDLTICPLCNGKLSSSIVHFGDSLPLNELEQAEQHSSNSDLFIVVGSSLVVYPAASMPKIALNAGAKLVIMNQGETPFDEVCHLRFWEQIGEVLPAAVVNLKTMLM